MPFDGTGVYSRVHRWQDDRDNGIRILADRHDEEDDSIAGALNQAFLRSGVVPMTGPLVMNGNNISQVRAGSALQPGLTFELDVDTGFFQPGAAQLAVSVSADTKMLWNDDGVQVFGDFSVEGEITSPIKSTGSITGKILVAQGASTEGGQFVIGYKGNEDVVGQENETWNIDVDGDNTFRVFRQDNAGAILTAININDEDGSVGLGNYIPPVNTASRLFVNGDASIIGGSARTLIFNGYHDGTDWKAQGAGYVQLVRSDFGTDGGIGIYTTAAPVAAGGTAALVGLATFRHDGIWLNKWITAGQGITAVGEMVAPVHRVTGTEFFMALSGGNPYINFDPGDYMMYDRVNNQLNQVIGGIPIQLVHSAGVNIAGTVTVNTPGTGKVKLNPGSATNTGYVAFHRNDDTRIGYVGFLPQASGGEMWYMNENGGGRHHFNNSMLVDAQISANDLYASHAVYCGPASEFYLYSGDGNWPGLVFDANDQIQYDRGSNNMNFYANGVRLQILGNSGVIQVNTTGWPNQTNVHQWGSTPNAWYNVSSYAYVNPSDMREKDWRGAATDAEVKAAQRIINGLGFFKWTHGASQDKLQFGVRAQHIALALMEEGVIPLQNVEFDAAKFIPENERPVFDLGMLEFASWEEQIVTAGEGGEITSHNPEGNRFAVNLDQLALFMIYAQSKQIASLDARIKAFEDL